MKWLVPESVTGSFLVRNEGIAFAGDLASFLDRHTYLYGQYERDSIDLFLSCVPPERRGVILDVGANVGTHSLVFARQFEHVHAFEPNCDVWTPFERNVGLNEFSNVTLHKLGLAERDAELDFHKIDAPNHGLGTFSAIEQYALPLKLAGRAKVVRGDSYLDGLGLDRVDAIKIDVQGFELAVLHGLADVLKRHRPIVWCEVGAGTDSGACSADSLKGAFPYAVTLLRLELSSTLLTYSTRLSLADEADLAVGDYVVLPR